MIQFKGYMLHLRSAVEAGMSFVIEESDLCDMASMSLILDPMEMPGS